MVLLTRDPLHFEEYLTSNLFTNVTLRTSLNEDPKIRAHAFILASVSPLLKEILLLEDEDKDILFPGVKSEDLQSLIQFLYTGRVDLPSRHAYDSFLDLLEQLQIKLSHQVSVDLIVDSTTLFNAAEQEEEDLWVLKDHGNNALTTLDDSEILYEFPIKLDEQPSHGNHQELLLELENIDPVPLLETVLSPPQAEVKRYPCSDCSKTFPSKYYLKFHRSSVHSTDTSHNCPLCNKGFSGEYYLRQHTRRMHSEGGRPHTCSICSSSFGLKYDLIIHQRTHDKIKRFRCGVCNKTYSNSRALKEHSRTHTGEKPYECKECKKCFALPKTLRVHYRQHSGERPYLCPTCGMTFIQNSTLKNHIKSQHSNIS